ncbi:MAG: phosphoribosylamine--glycine ligase [bacterium]|nr:phosphoribosylamine--glycine ligase [bacterium]
MARRVLLLGGGGREAALAWAFARSPLLAKLFAAPGNPGMGPRVECVPGLDMLDAEAVIAFCRARQVDLVFIGPEQPLVAGVGDALSAAGVPVFGPSRAAAELEGSKAWAKAFMARHQVPTAAHASFTDLAEALAFLEQAPWPVVIKASGLAAGKGVVLPTSDEEARAALRAMLGEGAFGEAGATVVIEQRMSGPELSVFALCDGQRAWILGSARDHKRLGEGDTGPNTGGMGAIAPSPLATPALLDRVRREILDPVLAGMAGEGRAYRGILYLGLMLTEGGPCVIEFNCRLGDPETQALLPLLEIDLLQLAWDLACGGRLPAREPPMVGTLRAACVVLAAEGYPGPARRGDLITGLENLCGEWDLLVFHAGTALDEAGRLVSAGGRVLGLTALGRDAATARQRALAAAACVRFAGCHYRKDIGA